MKNLLTRAQAGADPKRLFYDVQKLKVRGERLVESFERISGARPGQRLQVDIRGITPLERTIRIVARQLALAITAGSALVACGATAAAVHVARWVPITLGAIGGDARAAPAARPRQAAGLATSRAGRSRSACRGG